MSVEQYITIAILALTFAFLIKSKIPPVAVFVGALTLTITFRLAPLGDSLKGFSNSGMLTVGALLMVAAGMYRTGARIKHYDRAAYASMITNLASAVFMFPIAMVMAGNLGVNGMPFAITVMVGASCSFISPMGYQTNLMVYGPGGYKFTDFVKIGIPMTVVVGIITIFLTPLVWPF